MAKKAILSVCGQDFRLLEFNISLAQQINKQGKPASGVYLGDFYLIMQGDSDLFFDWLSDYTRMESGIVKIFYKNQDSPFVEYSFVQAYVTTILENLYDNDQIGNSFNQISILEDTSEEFELWTNLTQAGGKADADIGVHALTNSVAKTRQFQQRTGMSYVLMVTLSCEKITIRNLEHDNQWAATR